MFIEKAIKSFERIGKKLTKEKNELIYINNVLGGVGISSIDLKIIENINETLSDYDIIIPALKQHLDEGIGDFIYDSNHFKHIIQRYENKKTDNYE